MANAKQLRNLIFNLSLGAATAALAITAVLTLVLIPTGEAQTYKVIYNFTGGQDGSTPYTGLTMGGAGRLYGTTAYGSYSGGTCQRFGCGTVFSLTRKNSAWVLSALYSFQGANDGGHPLARAIIGPDGTLYGTTTEGGNSACEGNGCGTVFNLRPPPTFCPAVSCPWIEAVLYRFSGGSDGAHPETGTLIFDQAGHLYGTTLSGGTFNCGDYTCGVVFELEPSNGSWTENVLYNFTGVGGGHPFAGVVFDKAGNLYGTASYGPGVVFQLTPSGSGWTPNTLHTFQGGNDGSYPYASLIFDPWGNLYGTTAYGGADNGGTVFELTPSNGSWTYTLVYTLTAPGGEGPWSNLVMDSAGNLYGTSRFGGIYGAGAVFELTPTNGGWSYTSLHDFTGASDGGGPIGDLILDAKGNLYGTASEGGRNLCFGNGCGVVFEITP